MTTLDRRKLAGLVLDTNLLILYIVGMYAPERISSFKRTNTYSAEDFAILANCVNQFNGFHTAPNILTEVCNLIDKEKYNNTSLLVALTNPQIGLLDEHYIDSRSVMYEDYDKAFIKFGLTDAVIYGLAKRHYLILTDDLPLWAYLYNKNLPAYNFNNLRTDLLLG